MPRVKFGIERIMVWGFFFSGIGVELLNALAYRDFLDNFMPSTLWKQFGDGHSFSDMTVHRSKKRGL